MRENYSIDDFNGVTNVHDVKEEGKRKNPYITLEKHDEGKLMLCLAEPKGSRGLKSRR